MLQKLKKLIKGNENAIVELQVEAPAQQSDDSTANMLESTPPSMVQTPQQAADSLKKRKQDAHSGIPIRLYLTEAVYKSLKSIAKAEKKTMTELITSVAGRIAELRYPSILGKAVIYSPSCFQSEQPSNSSGDTIMKRFFMRLDPDLLEKLESVTRVNEEKSVNALLSRVARVVALGDINLQKHCTWVQGLPSEVKKKLKEREGEGVEFF